MIGASSFNSIASGADASYGAAPTNLKTYLDRLVSYYSDTISGYDDRFLILKNGKRFRISENRTVKTFRELIEMPDVDDMFHAVYPSGTVPKQPEKNMDPGRVRYEALFVELPVDQKNVEAVSLAGSTVATGIVDMNPTDPIEAMLISQIVLANEAILKLYRLGWANTAEYFEAGTKYLQMANKASRTVAMLMERLDQHRNRG
jgi:hypothetical protein